MFNVQRRCLCGNGGGGGGGCVVVKRSNGEAQANGIEDNDSLLANGSGGEGEDSYESFIGGPDPYLDNEDEGLNLMCVEEEVNIHDQWEKDEEDPMPDQDEYVDHVTDEDEDGERMNEETFTHEQFLQGPIEGMTIIINYVVFACDKKRKGNQKKKSKRIDCKAQINVVLMDDGSWRVTKVVGEHNHALDTALSRFIPSHRKVSKSLKRQLVAHDIAGLRPSKSIRLLEVKAGGPNNLRYTPKDRKNYIL
ncbi:hypothetical protein RND71_041487 [Anisodus tanguticus]|uniref:FAR1 domain-containing protein n=1 Tax=Anisodus tanguticus TaxID=243964 RepID=A0AAE1QUP2_9SOLA|nr:hypothetical protein RND71_041487 [Anisodus tanguticus]